MAEPGTSWGGTNIADPLSILGPFDPEVARPDLRLLMVSTTGEHFAYFELDDELTSSRKRIADALARIRRRASAKTASPRCALYCSWAARVDRSRGSHRESSEAYPFRARRASPASPAAAPRSMSGPAEASPLWWTFAACPQNAFGYVPTPALVAPIEFSLKLSDYAALGGHMDHVRPLSSIQRDDEGRKRLAARSGKSLATQLRSEVDK